MDRGGFPNLKTIKTFLYNSVQHRCLNYLRDLEIRDRNYRNLKREELDEDYFLCQQIRAEVVAELFGAIVSCRISARRFLNVLTWMDRRIRRLPKSWIYR